jgi:hypothetical protein
MMAKEKRKSKAKARNKSSFWKNNSLSIIMFSLFLVFFFGVSIAGFYDYNAGQRDNGRPELSYPSYLGSGSFLEVVVENWEGEFFPIFTFIVLSIYFKQRGSEESKNPEGKNPQDISDTGKHKRGEPKIEEKPGFMRFLYEHSLGITFFTLFIITYFVHLWAGTMAYNQEQAGKGLPALSMLQFWGNPRFWYQSFQNWQSEFLAIGLTLVFTIFMRQKGSSQSKPVMLSNRKNR